MRIAAALLAGALLAVGSVHAQDGHDEDAFIRSLDWKIGPTTVTVPGGGVFQVPRGIMFLGEEDSAMMQEYYQNLATPGETTFAPASLEWFALFAFDEIGYVEDDEAVDADEVMASLREGQEYANEELEYLGWETLTILGWEQAPHYDNETQRLEWAVRATSAGEDFVNFNTRILGRYGVMEVVLVTGPEELAAHVPAFKDALTGFSFVPSSNYAAYQPGDRVAEYGLAALIAGGAAAVALKSGTGKALIKLVLGGLAGLVALVAGLFGRKKKPDTGA